VGLDRSRQANEAVDYLGVKHLIKKFSSTSNSSNAANAMPCNIRSSSVNCKKSSKKKAAAMINFNKFNHSRVVSDDSEDYDEYSGDEDEDNEM